MKTNKIRRILIMKKIKRNPSIKNSTKRHCFEDRMTHRLTFFSFPLLRKRKEKNDTDIDTCGRASCYNKKLYGTVGTPMFSLKTSSAPRCKKISYASRGFAPVNILGLIFLVLLVMLMIYMVNSHATRQLEISSTELDILRTKNTFSLLEASLDETWRGSVVQALVVA